MGRCESPSSLVDALFSTTELLRMKIKRLWEYKDVFSVFCKIFVKRPEGKPLNDLFVCLYWRNSIG